MLSMEDKVEMLLGQKEEEEVKKKDVEGKAEDEDENDDNEEEDGSDDEDEASKEEDASDEEEDGCEKEEDNRDSQDDEGIPTALIKTEKQKNLPVPPKEKKSDDVLNLNNEVVKMRKEVKKVRALIIRKLTRQIGALKKKKGKDAEIERNQRRAARLLEEIHAMKPLLPDLVTKTALQKDLNFEQVCKNPKSTISDRAIARIATHPQFNKKIKDIKAAVKAFKEERLKGGKQGRKEKVQNQAIRVNPQSPDRKEGLRGESNMQESTEVQKERTDIEKGDGILKGPTVATVAKPERETVKVVCSADTAKLQKKDMPEFECKPEKSVSVKNSQVKDAVKDKERKPAVPQKSKDDDDDDDESDLELSEDEEKEYFDDSTEERFHKQSSQSEESDEDDFFVGKVSKFKKIKKKEHKSIAEEEEKKQDMTKDLTDKVQSELDDLEARLKSKATSMQSVFCSSLSGTKQRRGGAGGAGRGRGGEKFRGQGKMKSGPNRDFSRQSKYQTPEKGEQSEEKGSSSVARGRGRGRGDAVKHSHRGGGMFSHQAPQQALHPSWEASKKRKEQQGQILAFQGKKIKFDDD